MPSLKELVELHNLSFSSNELSVLPDSISCCTKLKFIDASSNTIMELFGQIPWSNVVGNLQHFLLTNNDHLREVPSGLMRSRKLRDLQVKENPLRHARLKKLAASTRPGNALMNYLEKWAKGAKEAKEAKQKTSTSLTENAVSLHNCTIHSPLAHKFMTNAKLSADDNMLRVEVLRPQDVKGGLRPRIFAYAVSGISFSAEQVLKDFIRFPIELNGLISLTELSSPSSNQLPVGAHAIGLLNGFRLLYSTEFCRLLLTPSTQRFRATS